MIFLSRISYMLQTSRSQPVTGSRANNSKARRTQFFGHDHSREHIDTQSAILFGNVQSQQVGFGKPANYSPVKRSPLAPVEFFSVGFYFFLGEVAGHFF